MTTLRRRSDGREGTTTEDRKSPNAILIARTARSGSEPASEDRGRPILFLLGVSGQSPHTPDRTDKRRAAALYMREGWKSEGPRTQSASADPRGLGSRQPDPSAGRTLAPSSKARSQTATLNISTMARLSRLSQCRARPLAKSPSCATALRRRATLKLDRHLAERRRECRRSVGGRSEQLAVTTRRRSPMRG
jgi:hypothetical protein